VRWSRRGGGAALAAGLVGSAVVLSEGPPPGRTGGFGEPSCQQCHTGVSVNLSGAGLGIDSLPPGYLPGASYRLVVRLSREHMRRGGFQVAVRFADGSAAGKQAGVLVPRDSMTRISLLAGRAVQYLNHTRPGSTLVTPGSAHWTFDWTAPTTGGAVVFNLAANAANDDMTPHGDAIYIREYRVGRKR